MCWYCGQPIHDPDPIGRSQRCSCGKDLRCCRHCRNYLPGSHFDCAEPGAEPVADKERSNFCDWFQLNNVYRSPTAGQKKSSADSGAAAFNSLFKD